MGVTPRFSQRPAPRLAPPDTAPAEQPRIALVVLAENGGHGGSTAAPIARKVMDYYLLGKVPQPLPDLSDKEVEEHD